MPTVGRDLRRKFTVRFTDDRVHSRLQTTAQALGISMNDLVARYIDRQLRLDAAGLEMELERTLELLRSYPGLSDADMLAEADSYGRAEAAFDDPIQAVMVDEAVVVVGATVDDPYGIRANFAYPMEH